MTPRNSVSSPLAKSEKFKLSESDLLHQITELEKMLHEKSKIIEDQKFEISKIQKNSELSEQELLKKLKSKEDKNASLQYELDEIRRQSKM